MAGLYGLPGRGADSIRAELDRLASIEVVLLGEVLALKKAFAGEFGYSLPITLAKAANRKYAPVQWRDMVRHRAGQGKNAQVVITLDGELGQQVLGQMAPARRLKLLDIEAHRIHLNHALGLVLYEQMRWRRLWDEHDLLAQWVREGGRH